MGLSTVAPTEIFDRRPGGQGVSETPLRQMESTQSAAGKTIQGEVLRVEGQDGVMKDQEGKQCGCTST